MSAVRVALVERSCENVGDLREKLKERTKCLCLVMADIEKKSNGNERGLERVFV